VGIDSGGSDSKDILVESCEKDLLRLTRTPQGFRAAPLRLWDRRITY
jgi:hypothetical protein